MQSNDDKYNIKQEFIFELLDYNPSSGIFHWKKKLSNRINRGDIAGCYTGRYGIISILNHRYPSHHIAWLYMYGEYPNGQIDHIDQNTMNNSICNLRIVTSKDNNRNKPKRRDNTSGLTNISFDKYSGKWVVRIKNNLGIYENRGRFNTIIEAKSARDKAITEIGYSERHGMQYSRLQYRKK